MPAPDIKQNHMSWPNVEMRVRKRKIALKHKISDKSKTSFSFGTNPPENLKMLTSKEINLVVNFGPDFIQKCFQKLLLLAFEANSAASLNCTFFLILAYCILFVPTLHTFRPLEVGCWKQQISKCERKEFLCPKERMSIP